MAAKNDVTGDSIQTKAASQAYQDNWDRIFGKKNSDSTKHTTVQSKPETKN